MGKKILVICLTALLFISASVLGVSAVFRVREVTLEKSVVSEAASIEAESLKTRLEEAYLKDCTLFVDKSDAEEIIKEFPYFRLTGFKKSQPNRIVVSVAEDAEVYALEKADGSGYYQLNAKGEVLGSSETPKNRLDGRDNVLLKGFTPTIDGVTLVGDECLQSALAFSMKIDEAFGGIRRNVLSVEVFHRTPSQVCVYRLREGVKFYVVNPSKMTEEKANAALNKYLSLSDGEKLRGAIVVSDRADGVVVEYAETDDFQA